MIREPDFAKPLSGQAISSGGSAVTAVGMPLAAVVVLHASSRQTGVLSGLWTLPEPLFGLFAGVRIDPISACGSGGRPCTLGGEMSMPSGLVIGSDNAGVGIEHAIAVLRAGGSPVDAVVAAIGRVEANPEDHSVGLSGLPNVLGQVELDASLMEGRSLRAGAVGAVHDHGDAIELARRVMTELPHVLITGAGADRLADETGMEAMELLTPESRRIWSERLGSRGKLAEGEGSAVRQVRALARELALDPQLPPDVHGTVNVIARDRNGNIACGVSTSGFAWKYPGRLGDSPIIGAGNYADDRWGAAACTGFGELAMRCCTAHSVVTFMRFGRSLEESLRMAMADIAELGGGGQMNIVAMDRDGNHAAASTVSDKSYIYMTEDMDTYRTANRLHVPMAT